MTGDIVGSPGRSFFARTVARMRRESEVDFVVANAENAAGGSGLTPKLADELFAAGADVLTLGDHAWRQKEIIEYIKHADRVIRPVNVPSACPGTGSITVPFHDTEITIINGIGRVFMEPNDCPFRAIDAILDNHKPGKSKIILVDFHAEATSEKIAMGRYLDGRVTAIVGTHTHVQTADETILQRGTAYITDLGMTGPVDSVLGRELRPVLSKFLTGMPARFDVATNCDATLQGVVIDVDETTGRARNITRVREQG